MSGVQRVPVLGVLALAGLLAAIERSVELDVVAWVVGLGSASVAAVLLRAALRRAGTRSFGAANTVTLTRAVLGQAVAALVALSFVNTSAMAAHRPLLVGVTVVALLLDAVDGRVARHTGSVSPLGARFDMEVDAFLILVLSVAVGPAVGWWVLLIGAARYALLVAERVWPWLRAPVPLRYWCKVVAAIQGVVLTVAMAQVLPAGVVEALLVVALALLAESFGRDVWWLSRRRTPAVARPVSEPVSVGAPRPRAESVRG